MFRISDCVPIRLPFCWRGGNGEGMKGAKWLLCKLLFFRGLESPDNCNLQFQSNVVFSFTRGRCVSWRRRWNLPVLEVFQGPESELSICSSKEFGTRCGVSRRRRVTLWFALHYTPWLIPWRAFAKWWFWLLENTLKLSFLPHPLPRLKVSLKDCFLSSTFVFRTQLLGVTLYTGHT